MPLTTKLRLIPDFPNQWRRPSQLKRGGERLALVRDASLGLAATPEEIVLDARRNAELDRLIAVVEQPLIRVLPLAGRHPSRGIVEAREGAAMPRGAEGSPR